MIRIGICAFVGLIAPCTAFAYLDPGSGSLLFQSLLAVLFGIGVAWRNVREFIAKQLRRLVGREPDDARP